MSVIVTGDDVLLLVQLKKNGAPFVISSAASIKAAVISPDHCTVLIGPSDQSAAAPGASWSTALVAIQFSSAQTAAILSYRPAFIEIEVNDGGKLTWFAGIDVVKGLI